MFCWTRTFYAKYLGTIYQFEVKKQRGWWVKNMGFEKVPAVKAYEDYSNIRRVDWRKMKEFIKNHESK